MLPSYWVTKYHRDYSLCSTFVSAEEYNVPSEVTDEFPNIQYFPVETARAPGTPWRHGWAQVDIWRFPITRVGSKSTPPDAPTKSQVRR